MGHRESVGQDDQARAGGGDSALAEQKNQGTVRGVARPKTIKNPMKQAYSNPIPSKIRTEIRHHRKLDPKTRAGIVAYLRENIEFMEHQQAKPPLCAD
jgi:hypothetical protein